MREVGGRSKERAKGRRRGRRGERKALLFIFFCFFRVVRFPHSAFLPLYLFSFLCSELLSFRLSFSFFSLISNEARKKKNLDAGNETKREEQTKNEKTKLPPSTLAFFTLKMHHLPQPNADTLRAAAAARAFIEGLYASHRSAAGRYVGEKTKTKTKERKERIHK